MHGPRVVLRYAVSRPVLFGELELIRLRRVKVYQRERFGSTRVFRPVGPDAAPAPPAESEEKSP